MRNLGQNMAFGAEKNQIGAVTGKEPREGVLLRFHPLFSMAGAIAVSALGIFCVIIAAAWEWRAGSVRKGKTG